VTAGRFDNIISQDRYEVLEMLGQGSHGIVYRAFDKQLKHEIAIKTLRSRDAESLFRLKREFRALASIKHRNLVSLYELEVQDDVFITMEYLRGTDLLSTLERLPPLQRTHSLRDYLQQILLGLSQLHANDKLHRDIKPGNVLVEDNRVVLVDFGMATGLESRASMMSIHTGMAGTLAYMAPEQLHSKALTTATDLFSVGVLLYECLTGQLPRETVQEIFDSQKMPPAPVEVASDAALELSDITMQLMSPEPTSRPTIEELLTRLGSPVKPAERPDYNDTVLGRNAELAQFQAALDRVHSGEAVSLAIRGPSGIGKSSLIETFLDRVERRREALIFRSRCHPSEYIRYEALDGLVDEVSRFLSHLSEEQIEAYLPRHMEALSQVFPVISRVLPTRYQRQSTPQADERELRRIAFEALRQLIARIGDRQTTILWIDDLQWGDSDSANLIREILREPDAPPVLFVFSYRTGEVHSPLLQDLLGSESGGWRAVHNIDIQPLSLEDSEQLLADLVAENDWPAEARNLLVEAEGSPFLIGELANSIRDTTISSGNFADIRLEELVKRRLTNLTPDLFRLLAYIAISEGPIRRSVALAACELEAAGVEVSAALESQSLIKTVHADSELAFDTYHDRFRSAMLEVVDIDMRVSAHVDILEVLEEESACGPELLAFHALRAGRMESMVEYSTAAAELAEIGLAFSFAAEFYEQALTHGNLTQAARADLLEKSGKASALAGSGAAAAGQFQQAATLLESMGSCRVSELQAAAAEQFFASGYLTEGHAILKPLLLQRKISFPKSAARAAISIIPMALGLRFFGARLQAVDQGQTEALPPDTELLWSLAKGLGAMDSLRASYFNCLGLRVSLACGNRAAATQFQCGFAGTTLVPAGGILKRWGLSMLGEAEQTAKELDNPYLIGLVTVVRGQTHLQSGAWRDAVTLCDEGTKHLLEHASGVAWECDLAAMGALRALEELGDFHEMYARAERWLIQSEAVADKYAVTVAKGYRMMARIALDELDLAEEDSKVIDDLSSSNTNAELHHIYNVRGLALVKLAQGEAEQAWTLLEGAWPRLKSSGLLFAQIVRIDMWSLRARVALATAATQPERLGVARKGQKILGREERADAQAWSALITGLGCWQRGEDSHSENLAQAAELFSGVHQTAMSAVCQYRFCQFSNDEQGAREQKAVLLSCGVNNAEHWAAAMAPAQLKTG
jgi:serine/threonine protein kinase